MSVALVVCCVLLCCVLACSCLTANMLLHTVRNAYILIDFGDFVDGSSSKVGTPYIQLLPTTQPALAHAEFVQTRLGGVDNTSSIQLLPAMNTTSSPDGDDGDDDSDGDGDESWWDKYKWYVIGGAAGLALLAALALSVCFVRRRRRAAGTAAYKALRDPASAPGGEPMFARYDPGSGVVQGRGQGGYVPAGAGYAPPGYAPPGQRY